MTFEMAGIDVNAKGKWLLGEKSLFEIFKTTSNEELSFPVSLSVTCYFFPGTPFPQDAQSQHNIALLALNHSTSIFYLKHILLLSPKGTTDDIGLLLLILTKFVC